MIKQQLHLPGMDVDLQPPSDARVLAALARLSSQLEGVIRQLDLLIRMESGQTSRKSVAARISGYDGAAAQEEAEAK